MSITASQIVAQVLVQGAEQAIAQLKAVGAANDSAATSSDGFLGRIQGMGQGLLDFFSKAGMAAMGLQAFGQAAVSIGSFLFGQDAALEQTTVAFTQLLGSSQAANAELKDLQQFAASTPFEFPELADATQKLIAFQFPLKETKPLLTAIGDALSGLGENTPATLEQVVHVFGQMHSTTHLMTGDLMQLTSVGINGFQILADQMHKPVSAIREMVTKGLIPANEGIEMLRKGMEKTFGGGMAAQAQTFNGLMSTLQDGFGALLRSFTGPLFIAAKEGLGQLVNLVSSPDILNFATNVGQVLGDALSKVGATVSWVIRQFQVWGDLLANNSTWQLFISEVVDGWNSVMDAFSAFGDWVSSMWPSVMQGIQGAWENTIGVLAAGVAWIVNEIHDFAGQWNTVWAAIQGNPYVQAVERTLGNVFTNIKDAFMDVLNWFETNIPKIPAWFAQTWDAIQNNPVFKKLQEIATSIFEGIKNAALDAAAFIQAHWGDVVAFILGKLHDLWQFVGPIFDRIAKIAQQAFESIKQFVGPIIDWLINNWQNIPGIIAKTWQQVTSDPHFKIFMRALQDAGEWIVTRFIPVWDQLVATFQTQVVPSLQHLQKALEPLLPLLKPIGEFIGGVLLFLLGIVVSLLAGFIQGLANFLQGAIQFVGGVIQIFSGLIEFFQGMWMFLYDLFTGNWAKLGADLQVMSLGIQDIFMGLWNGIVGYIKMSFGTVLGFVWGFITGFIGYFQFLYDELVGHSIIPDLVNGILSWIASLPGKALAFINQMVTNLLSKFDTLKTNAITKAQEVVSGIAGKLSNLGSLALSWGQDLMKNLTAGINNGLGGVSNAAQNVANTISQWIHFSKPDIGPLKDADQWMPDFTDLLSRGLRAGASKFQAAMGELVMPLTVMASQSHASSTSVAASAVSMPTSGSSQPFVIQVLLPDGSAYAEYLVDPVMHKVMRTTNRKSGRRGL